MIKFGKKEVKKKGFYKTKQPIEIFKGNRNNKVLSDVTQSKKLFKSMSDIL